MLLDITNAKNDRAMPLQLEHGMHIVDTVANSSTHCAGAFAPTGVYKIELPIHYWGGSIIAEIPTTGFSIQCDESDGLILCEDEKRRCSHCIDITNWLKTIYVTEKEDL